MLPLNDLHARILAVRGAIAEAEGLPPLSAWVANPWDFLRPVGKPPAPGGPDIVSIAAMNGETRAGAVNFANSTGRLMTVSLHLTGSGSDLDVSDLRLYEVMWTDTRELVPVADALVPLSAEAPSFDLPAGMTRQIWMSLTPKSRAAGVYGGYLEARSDDVISTRVPFELRVLSGTFPDRPTLHLGGWDYTDRNNFLGLTPNNTKPLIQQLRALKVDSPWATSSVMPAGSFDALGQMVKWPSTSMFDNWVGSWPDAKRYFVFVSARGMLGNVATTETIRFATAAGQWIAFWVAHASQMGIQPSQLMLLLVDEPHSASQDDQIATWARAIKAAQPDVGIWENPTYPDPAGTKPQLLGVSDVAALKRSLLLQQGVPFAEFYKQWATGGRTLNVYGASGPARLLDPYTYDRLQAWTCADIGATSSFFWSFSDDAGGRSWNEYATTQAPYSPFFLSDHAVTISKHSEAIREGVEDFEYLTMLRQKVAAVGQTDPTHSGLSEAVGLLESAIGAVLHSPGATDLQWASAKDRSAAERMRRMIADALGVLTKIKPTVAVTDGGFTYDGTAHAAMATATGIDGGPVAGTFTFTYTPGGSSIPVSAGTYAVTATFTSLDPNYDNATTMSSISISKATAWVTPAASGKTYGAVDPPPSGTLGGFIAADAVTATYSRTPGETAASGPYTINATLAPADLLGNYDISYNTAPFRIEKAPLTITAQDASRVVGAPDPPFTASAVGFVLGDGPSVLDGMMTFTTPATGSSSVGVYPVTPGGVTSDNYAITFVSGVLTIEDNVPALPDEVGSSTEGIGIADDPQPNVLPFEAR